VPGASNSNLEEAEGTFYWPADGVHGVDGSPISYALTPTSDLLSDIRSGGYVSIIGTPADNEVGCLSNTPTQGNPAQLVVTAVAVPEPRSAVLILTALGITALGRWRRASRMNALAQSWRGHLAGVGRHGTSEAKRGRRSISLAAG
jgi:hypothetical protein